MLYEAQVLLMVFSLIFTYVNMKGPIKKTFQTKKNLPPQAQDTSLSEDWCKLSIYLPCKFHYMQ